MMGDDNITKDTLRQEVMSICADLGLSIDDVKGSVLEIGSDKATIARFFVNRSDVNVTSVNTQISNCIQVNANKADARCLPYKDSTFDIVVVYTPVLNAFTDIYSSEFANSSKESMKASVAAAFCEALRVLKSGKSAYFAPVQLTDDYEPQRQLKESIREACALFKRKGVDVTVEFLRTAKNPITDDVVNEFRVVITKPTTKDT